MSEGTAYHARHGRQVSVAGFNRHLAAAALLFALLLLAVGLTSVLLGQ